jgi:hypothetical protein
MTTEHHRLDLGWRPPTLLAGLAILLAVPDHVPSLRAQAAPAVAAVVARLHAYLDAYRAEAE